MNLCPLCLCYSKFFSLVVSIADTLQEIQGKKKSGFATCHRGRNVSLLQPNVNRITLSEIPETSNALWIFTCHNITEYNQLLNKEK